jgi:hypothetical protein
MGSIDAWQRPGVFSTWNGGWFLLAAAVLTAWWLQRLIRGTDARQRWLRIFCVAACFLIAAVGLRLGSDILGAQRLLHQMIQPYPQPRSEWLENTLDWVEGNLDKAGIPTDWLPEAPDESSADLETALYHHLETSRPSLRLRFAREAMTTAKPDLFRRPARPALTSWHRLFPPVTGADVTLRQRQRLWKIARDLHADGRAAAESRMAAALWMGLIVATDPEAFAEWRPVARKAMLSWIDPPMADTGDIWMRTLDLLLLPDPVDIQTSLTAQAAADPTWLRRAVRERVRAVSGHLRSALEILADSGSQDPGEPEIALWCDLATCLRIVGGGHDAALEADLRGMLVEWLLEDWSGTLSDRSQYAGESRLWGFLFRQSLGFSFDPLQDPADRERVLRRADDLWSCLDETRKKHLAERGAPQGNWLDDVDRLLIMRQLLGDTETKQINARLGNLLVDLAWTEVENKASKSKPAEMVWVTMEEALYRLAWIWTEIDQADRVRFSRITRGALNAQRQFHASGYDNQRSLIRAVMLDAASEAPQVEVTTRLLLSIGLPQSPALPRSPDRGPRHPLSEATGWYQTLAFSEEEIEAAIPGMLALEPDKGAGSAMMPHQRAQSMIRSVLRYHSDLAERELVIRALLAAGGTSRSERNRKVSFELLTGPDESLRFTLARMLGQHSIQQPHESWIDWVQSSPENLERLLDLETEQLPRRALMNRLESGRVDPEVMSVTLEHLERATRSVDRTVAFEAHACLLRLAPHLDTAAGRSIRERFMQDIRDRPPSIAEWPNAFSHGFDPYGLFYWNSMIPRALLSEGVPWADDELAAQFAWSSAIKLQTMRAETWKPPAPAENAAVFAVLAGAMVVDTDSWDQTIWFPEPDQAVDFRRWRFLPPEVPLDPTPWQLARQLHQRRPDLHFPDRAMLRPTRSPAD